MEGREKADWGNGVFKFYLHQHNIINSITMVFQ